MLTRKTPLKRTPFARRATVMGSVRMGRDPKRYFDSAQKRAIFTAAGWLCEACGTPLEMATGNADHRTPWNAGGRTEIGNGAALCLRDNKAKGNLGWEDFMRLISIGQSNRIEGY